MKMSVIFKAGILGLLFLTLSSPLSSQSIRNSVGLVQNDEKVKTKFKKPNSRKTVETHVQQKRKDFKNDTIYCTQTKKQYGWLLPMDTISKEVASHRRVSYRFTHRYPSGHWGKMEAVDAWGNYAPGYISPYIVKLSSVASDSAVNDGWVEKLGTSCVYEFIADPTGKRVVQERAYDKDGNIVYIFSRVPVDEKQYIGSYKDSYGLPAEMRKDSLFTYGTLVRLTEDRWGNDSIIEYIDAKGKRKLNSDGAAMEVYICDQYGHLLKQQSRDMNGNLIIDNWGNCGIEYEWDSKHHIASAIYMDDRWQSMRMPNKRSDVGDGYNVMKTVYKYDCYGRQTEQAFFTDKDEPDCNAYGVHRTTYEFDDKGYQKSVTNYDLKGAPVNGFTGKAFTECEYNSLGRLVKASFLDKDRKPCLNNDYLSKIVNKYDDEGNIVWEEKYAGINGQHVLWSRKDKKMQYQRWNDGTYNIDSLDSRGRLISSTYYDQMGNLDRNMNYAIYKCKYVDYPHGFVETKSYYDAENQLHNLNAGYAVRIERKDTLSDHIRSLVRLYDEQLRLIEMFIHISDSDGILREQVDVNDFGKVCRAGSSFSTRYYRAQTGYSCNGGSFSTLIGRDEFGEPDYIVSPGGIFYYRKLSVTDTDLDLDENSKVITDQEDFKNRCPKVMTIEVIDSLAYQLGLCDNDVILTDGSYAVDVFGLDSVFISTDKFFHDWTIHSVIDGDAARNMVVFRVDPETLKYRLVRIENLKGSPSELGYITHVRYLTQKQLRRIQNCVRENLESQEPLLQRADLTGEDYTGDHSVILACNEMYRNERRYPYGEQVMDPSIALAVCMKDGNMMWRMEDLSVDVFEKILQTRKMKFAKLPVQHFYLTRNGRDIVDLINTEKDVNTRWSQVFVSDKVYQKIYLLSQRAVSKMMREMKGAPQLKRKDLIGNWEFRSAGSKNISSVHVSLSKDGKMDGSIEQYDTIQVSGIGAIFRFRQNLHSEWKDYGKLLHFSELDENEEFLECVDLLDFSPTYKVQALEYLNEMAQEDPGFFLNKMNLSRLEEFVYIDELSKERLVIDNGTSNGLLLSRLSKRKMKKAMIRQDEPKVAQPSAFTPDVPMELNEDSRKLLGTWVCIIDEDSISNSNLKLKIRDNGVMDIEVDAYLRQRVESNVMALHNVHIIISSFWSFSEGIVHYKPDFSTFDFKYDIDLEGLEGEEKEAVLTMMRNELSDVKQETAVSILGAFASDSGFVLSNVTDTEIVLNDMKFTRLVESEE